MDNEDRVNCLIGCLVIALLASMTLLTLSITASIIHGMLNSAPQVEAIK